MYTKHQPKTLANRLAFAWFVLGIGLGAIVGAVRRRSLAPLRSFQVGLRNVLTDYRRSSILSPPTRAS